MSEVTLSPIPFNGGTLANVVARTIFRLSGDKYVMVYHQTNPDYIIAQVVEIVGIKTATPTVNVLRTQVINNISPAAWSDLVIDAVKLNETDFLLFAQAPNAATRVWACRVDPSTNVVTIISNNFLSFTRIANVPRHQASGQWYVAPNTVIDFSTVSSGTSGVHEICRISFNVESGTLSRTVLRTASNAHNSMTSLATACLTPDGSALIISIRGNFNSTSITSDTSLRSFVFRYNIAAQTLSVIRDNETTVLGIYVPTPNPTSYFAFRSIASYMTLQNNVAGNLTTFTSVSPSPTSSTVIHAMWLANNYILLEGLTATTRPVYQQTGRQFRIVRYIDDNTLQATDATNASNLTLFNTAGNVPQISNFVHREMYDGTTVLLFGISNNTCAVYALTA